MKRTQKVGTAGKFGARYGKRIKDRYVAIHKIQKQDYRCPRCLKMSLKRESVGIWGCTKCGLKLAGKAYKPS